MDESFEPTSERTVKSRAKSAISSSLRSRGISTVPSEISTWVRSCLVSQRLYSSSLSRAKTTSKNVPPMTTGLSRSTSSFRSRLPVTHAVPQPSLTMSMYSPAVSSTSSQARGPRPLSSTWVRPPSRAAPMSNRSEAGIELLQLLLGGGLDVVVERVAVGVDPDGERAEVLDPELPEALRHQLLPGDLLDLLDLGRLEGRGAADDREVDHPVLAHRLDRLVREAALAADRAHAVLRAERLGKSDHARGGRRADADLLVTAGAELAHAGCGVEEEGAAQIHRRLDALVEDPDLRAVADADDMPLDDDLVAGSQLQDLRRVGDRERDLVRRHGGYASRS